MSEMFTAIFTRIWFLPRMRPDMGLEISALREAASTVRADKGFDGLVDDFMTLHLGQRLEGFAAGRADERTLL